MAQADWQHRGGDIQTGMWAAVAAVAVAMAVGRWHHRRLMSRRRSCISFWPTDGEWTGSVLVRAGQRRATRQACDHAVHFARAMMLRQ